jgi:hypothetical protein
MGINNKEGGNTKASYNHMISYDLMVLVLLYHVVQFQQCLQTPAISR